MDQPTTKADHLAALIDALGLERAWQYVIDAPADKLDDATKQAVQREIVSRQLQRAQDMVKADGMGPPVLELLRLLVALLAPAAAATPAEAPPEEPPAPPDETQQAADVATPPAAPRPGPDDEQAKQLPPPEAAAQVQHDDPNQLGGPAQGLTGADGKFVQASKADDGPPDGDDDKPPADDWGWSRQADVAPDRHPLRERAPYVKR